MCVERKGNNGTKWDDIRYTVFYRDQGYCQYCGVDLVSSYSIHATFEVDHRLPNLKQYEQERDKPENLSLACRGCNAILGEPKIVESFESRKQRVLNSLVDDKWTWMPSSLLKNWLF